MVTHCSGGSGGGGRSRCAAGCRRCKGPGRTSGATITSRTQNSLERNSTATGAAKPDTDPRSIVPQVALRRRRATLPRTPGVSRVCYALAALRVERRCCKILAVLPMSNVCCAGCFCNVFAVQFAAVVAVHVAAILAVPVAVEQRQTAKTVA